jgi:hypothetical protein
MSKADIEHSLGYGEVINYTFDGVSIHSVTAKYQLSFPYSVDIEEGNH